MRASVAQITRGHEFCILYTAINFSELNPRVFTLIIFLPIRTLGTAIKMQMCLSIATSFYDPTKERKRRCVQKSSGLHSGAVLCNVANLTRLLDDLPI